MAGNDAVVWRFVGERSGDGRPMVFHMGIPARDLTEADVRSLSADELELVQVSALYVAVKAGSGKSAGAVKE